MTKQDRREFLIRTGTWATGALLAATASAKAGKKKRVKLSAPGAKAIGWQLACGLYSLRDRPFYEALDVIARLGIKNVEPCFFLRLSKEEPGLTTSESLSPDMRRDLKKRLDDYGVKMPNYYAPVDSDTKAFRKIFDFAKEMGVKTLVAEPPAEVFDKVEELCDEYRMNLAIHNHPKSPDSKYWQPENVLKVCKGRGRRIGACADTGHWVRSGLDPVECLRKLKGRIISMHLKDVAESGKPEARDVPLGKGKAKYADVLGELHGQRFRGVMTIEYEHLSDQLVEDIAECVKFVENFAKSQKS